MKGKLNEQEFYKLSKNLLKSDNPIDIKIAEFKVNL